MLILTLLAATAAALTLTGPVSANDLESFCNGVIAGIFPHPDPQLCYMYVSCAFEESFLYQCNQGFVFDVTISECVPGNWEDCDRGIDPELEQLCAGVSYGVFEYEGNCGKFVFCERGRPSVIECLEKEIWFQQDGACVFGNRDTCEPGDALCMGRPDGAVPHPDGCDMFIECVGERSTVVQCDRGMIFEEGGTGCVIGSLETCQSVEDVCVEHANMVHPHPELCDMFITCEGSTASLETCQANEVFRPDIQFCVPGNPITCVPSRPEVACIGRPDGIVPHPDECNQFIVCTGGSSLEQNCPIGQILRPEVPVCVTGNSDTCEFLDESCVGRPDRYVLQHPNYCGMFIFCMGGQALALPCPGGEILRPDMQFCVPGDLDTCEATEIEQMCEGRPDVIYPHPDRCDQYIRCNQGNLNINQCAPYMIVQPGTISCVPGNTETCELYVDLCRSRPDGIIPHPSRCHLYIDCRSEQVNIIQCPEGHIFDSSESRCVPGNTETCDHLDEYCVDRPDGVISHPNRCDLFMMCSAGVTSVHSCPWGEILREDMQFCVPGDRDTCQFAPIDRMCDDREGPLTYPHPDDCTLMVKCNQGQVSIEPCQEGTVLQPGIMQCVAGNADTCELYIDRCVDAVQDVIPHPSQCHLFMQCIAGQTLVGSCTRGMVFINGQCVIGDRVACESWQQICGNMGDQIIKHPNFCDLYIECRWGTTSMRPCNSGLILHPNMQVCTPGNPNTCEFNPEEEMCVGRSQDRFPPPDQEQCANYVTCSNGIGTTGTCGDGTVLRPRFIDCVPGNELTCEAFPHICLFRPNEYIPHPTRCDLFVSCISEIPHVLPCQRGEIFDLDRGLCVPGNAESCISYEGVCAGRDDTILEHPHHCDLFIVCTSGNATVHPCPPGEILVPELQFCFPGNVETCELHPAQDMCFGSSEEIFPHPENCNQFIKCVGQSSTISTCPDGKIYLPSTGSCVAGNAQNCEFYNERCRHHENGVIEFPTRCDLFLLCSSGLTTVHPCPEGEILNADIQFCMPGDRNTCTFYDVSTTTTEPPLMLICENIPDGSYSHPFLCHLYIECIRGQVEVQSCPSGNIWIPDQSRCAPGDWATCTPDVPPEEITNDICVRTGIYVIPHPFVCYKYVQCVLRVAFVEDCPRWHVFSAILNRCIPGDRDNC
ncbi:uncharacterized protein LOC135700101 [Ochlerotatus camptorhynchus]|uniref:uncharacterized protein LOC135700101 n=1 Tax=Ochlerotatus camptorhynchus TaxID=644619 RepID=UPI0031E2EC39